MSLRLSKWYCVRQGFCRKIRTKASSSGSSGVRDYSSRPFETSPLIVISQYKASCLRVLRSGQGCLGDTRPNR